MFIFCVFTTRFSAPYYSSGFISDLVYGVLYLRRLAECVCSLSVCHHQLGRRHYTVSDSKAAGAPSHTVCVVYVLLW